MMLFDDTKKMCEVLELCIGGSRSGEAASFAPQTPIISEIDGPKRPNQFGPSSIAV
jgi:hypothetical protein